MRSPVEKVDVLGWTKYDSGSDRNDQDIYILVQLHKTIALQQNNWAGFDTISDKE